MAVSLEKLKKHMYRLYIDVSGTPDSPKWARIGKSTVFTIAMNAEETTNDYIEDESPTTEVDKYQPSMDQELQTIKGDEAFDFLHDWFYEYSKHTGEAAKVKTLTLFPDEVSGGKVTSYKAWQNLSTITLNELTSTETKISFNVKYNGTTDYGTATVDDETDTPTFVPTE